MANFKKDDEERNSTNADRRAFLKGTAVAGVMGAVGASLGAAEPKPLQQKWAPSTDKLPPDIQADLARRAKLTEELPKPAGLRPNAQLDARFQVYYKAPVGESFRLLTDYFAAFAARDVEGVANLLHFPYATFEGLDPIVYQSAQDFIKTPPPSLTVTGMDEDQVRPGVYDLLARPGTYDILDNLQLHTYNPVNVGLELCYTRYRPDGQKIGINEGIYAITNNDGKWAIQLSSIIFTPTSYIGMKYRDVAEANLREGRNWQMGWAYHDSEMLADITQRRSNAVGKSAGITAPPGTDQWIRAARAGTPMEPYNTKGVKSRLQITSPRSDSMAPYVPGRATEGENPAFAYFYELASAGVGKYGYTLELPEARILHAGPDKAHTLDGYQRYTADSRQISETRSLGVMVYDGRKAKWGTAGSYGQMMRRDCTNDPERT